MPSSLSGLSSQCGTGYSVTPITRRSGSHGTLRAATESQSFVCRSSRIRHPSQARTAFGMTKLRSYEPFAHPPGCLVHPFRACPGSSGTGFIVHPCTRCSQGSPFGSTFGGYNSTIPWSRYSGLVQAFVHRLSTLTALAPRQAVPPLAGLPSVVFLTAPQRLGSTQSQYPISYIPSSAPLGRSLLHLTICTGSFTIKA